MYDKKLDSCGYKKGGNRVATHRWWQWAAWWTLAGALAVVEYSKFSQGKYHFVSWHGKVGIAACVLILSMAPMAALVRDRPRVLTSIPAISGMVGGVRGYWRTHRLAGLVTVAILGAAYALGWETGYMARRWDRLWGGAQYWRPVGWVLMACLGAVLARQVLLPPKQKR